MEGQRQDGQLLNVLQHTWTFYRCMWYFLVYPGNRGSYDACPYWKNQIYAKAQCYSLSLIFYLWKRPHYRSGTFQNDMAKNLRNVAIPGTGIPLSLFCFVKPLAYMFVLIFTPLICLAAAYNAQRKHGRRWAEAYLEQLLGPRDWFSYWRMNCRLASYHALLTDSKGYRQEDKWTFLVEAPAVGVPVSPVMDVPSIVVKDKNEEGGLGIFFYKNAMQGGDWIIQERLHNDSFVSGLLPDNAPLSTIRVISASRWWLQKEAGRKDIGQDCVQALSAVFRAGRQGASTDHSSILFDIDTKTGTIGKGTTNAHWYRLGLDKVFSTNWVSTHDVTHHPDNNKKLVGETIPDMAGILELVTRSHFRLLPDVPLVGWDVALTTKGVCMLEVNLSCNFFRGSFNNDAYVDFVDEYFAALDKRRRAGTATESTTSKKNK